MTVAWGHRAENEADQEKIDEKVSLNEVQQERKRAQAEFNEKVK